MTIPSDVLVDPYFRAFLRAAAANRELVAEFDRLTGSNLLRRGSPIELAVDDATGRAEADVAAFVGFVVGIYKRVKLRPTRPGGTFRRAPAKPQGLTHRPFEVLGKKGGGR